MSMGGFACRRRRAWIRLLLLALLECGCLQVAEGQGMEAGDLVGVWEGHGKDITIEVNGAAVTVRGQLQWTGTYDAGAKHLVVTAKPTAAQMCCTDIPLDIRKKIEGKVTVKLDLTLTQQGETLKLAGKFFKGDIQEQRNPDKTIVDATVGQGDGPAEDIEYTKSSLCETLYPRSGATTTRSPYAAWVKELLCKYIKADFTNDAARREVVGTMLTSLEAHSAEAKVKAAPDVVHIVTHDPMLCSTKVAIKGARAARSTQQVGKAAIGLEDSLFKTPKAASRQDADARLPNAETALLGVYGLKSIADTMSENAGAIKGDQTAALINGNIETFRSGFVKQAAIVTLSDIDIDRQAEAPSATEPTAQDAHNIVEILPKANATRISIAKVNGALGVTQSVAKTRTAPSIVPQAGSTESIEPKDVCTNGYAVQIEVQTFLRIALSVGGGKRVFSADGKKDCTDAIAAHERRHANDTADAWDQEVIEGLRAGLAGSTANETDKGVRIKRENNDGGVWTSVLAKYLYPSQDKATKAKAALQPAGEAVRKSALKKFNDTRVRKADAYHRQEQDSIDDNCTPAKGGQGNHTLGGDAAAPTVDEK